MKCLEFVKATVGVSLMPITFDCGAFFTVRIFGLVKKAAWQVVS